MSRRISLTIEEHRVLAVELHAMRDRLVDLRPRCRPDTRSAFPAQARKGTRRSTTCGTPSRARWPVLILGRWMSEVSTSRHPIPPPWVVEARKVGGVA